MKVFNIDITEEDNSFTRDPTSLISSSIGLGISYLYEFVLLNRILASTQDLVETLSDFHFCLTPSYGSNPKVQVKLINRKLI